ncbi:MULTISPECIES: hypothetical protein [Bacillus amyloliquefaciens group]|uniref:hypothetical protein n=1 Tax=Bacillus amyloliquefaciens group TaxID=1938374 RepID=UPI00077D8D97|nr:MULTISPECIES: hypothetical protein [Bacillus amyloliquefaciens group]AMQ71806.1 hypothetical protein BAMY6614_00010 [Bacillus amyloliquefaciens UMAF6614]
MKKFASVLLVLCLLMSLAPNVLALEKQSPVKSYSEEQYDKQDILPLEKYVSVKNGLFALDYEKAKADGIEKGLLDGQKAYFEYLNDEITAGKLEAKKDLSIVEKTESASPEMAPLACKGKNYGPKHYWWGYHVKMNSCATDNFVHDMNTAGSTAAGIAVFTAYFGFVPGAIPGAASVFFGLMANRADANNKGKGVKADITWALAFSFSPQ